MLETAPRRRMTKKPKGWVRETARHSLAARGIKTGSKKKSNPSRQKQVYINDKPARVQIGRRLYKIVPAEDITVEKVPQRSKQFHIMFLHDDETGEILGR